MLRKIDCVMIRVDDVEAAAAYYTEVFGLRPNWSGDDSIGLVFPETARGNCAPPRSRYPFTGGGTLPGR